MKMREFPPVDTRLIDPRGITWRVDEVLGHIAILEAHGLTRRATLAQIADWKVLR